MKSVEVDGKAWVKNPSYNYVYNKLWLCKVQGIKCAPAGVEPDSYPVFYKPVINLYSLGAGSFKAEKPVEGRVFPGLFWMQHLEGRHWTFDCFYEGGEFTGVYALEAEKENDEFKLWKPVKNPDVESLELWVRRHLSGYVGKLNLEIIGDKLIEVHLRHSQQLQKMRSSGKDFCAPIFGENVRYQPDFSHQNAEFVSTLGPDGFPEPGLQNRIGYVMAQTRKEAMEAKRLLTDSL